MKNTWAKGILTALVVSVLMAVFCFSAFAGDGTTEGNAVTSESELLAAIAAITDDTPTTIYVDGEFTVSSTIIFGDGVDVKLNVTLKGAGEDGALVKAVITKQVNTMFTVKAGSTLTFENITCDAQACTYSEGAWSRPYLEGSTSTRRYCRVLYIHGGATANLNAGTTFMHGMRSDGTGACILAEGALNMYEGAVITENYGTGAGGAAVYVGTSNGSFNMYGGEISYSLSSGSYGGGGVCCYHGVFNMHDGKISNNMASSGSAGGGGVCVVADNGRVATFNMYGGEISDNSANGNGYGGGGVYVNRATFNMYDGTIKNNTTPNSSGAGIRLRDANNKNTAVFNMYGGSITGNTTPKTSGAIHASSAGFINIYDGEISYNSADSYGGAISAEGGSLTIKGGKFFGNNGKRDGASTSYAGGLICASGSTTKVIIENGTKEVDGEPVTTVPEFYENEGKWGAVLWLNTSTTPTVEIKGGYFHDNTARADGSVIYTCGTAVNITGGRFEDNVAAGNGAIVVTNNAVVTFSGDASVTGNKGNGGETDSNVYLVIKGENSVVTLADSFTGTIGASAVAGGTVALEKADSAIFATGTTGNVTSDAGYTVTREGGKTVITGGATKQVAIVDKTGVIVAQYPVLDYTGFILPAVDGGDRGQLIGYEVGEDKVLAGASFAFAPDQEEGTFMSIPATFVKIETLQGASIRIDGTYATGLRIITKINDSLIGDAVVVPGAIVGTAVVESSLLKENANDSTIKAVSIPECTYKGSSYFTGDNEALLAGYNKAYSVAVNMASSYFATNFYFRGFVDVTWGEETMTFYADFDYDTSYANARDVAAQFCEYLKGNATWKPEHETFEGIGKDQYKTLCEIAGMTFNGTNWESTL